MSANDLPISEAQAIRVTEWMMANYDDKLAASVRNTVFRKKHLCAIVCQETAYAWTGWMRRISADELLGRCVLDASGDASGSTRGARPRNTAEFRRDFGAQFSNMLIREANLTRRLRGYGEKQWVYKGYGIFQYDLQYVYSNESFFREKGWYSFDRCLANAIGELKTKYAATNDLWKAIERYNGSGPAARRYAANVKRFTTMCERVTND